MLTFLTRVLAVIGFIVVALIALGVWGVARIEHHAAREPDALILTIDFTRPVVENGESSPLDFALEDEPVVLLDLLRAIDRARDDKRVKGIVATFGTEQPSLPHAQEIRAALARFRAADPARFTYAYGSDYGAYGAGNRAYYLASAFEHIWLQPVGGVSLTGVGAQSFFGKAALDRLGLSADFMQREEYKSLMEQVMRDGYSAPVRAEMQAMIENLAGQIAAGIAESRKWDVAKVKALMEQGPFTDEEAQQAGLVTRLAYADELDEEVEKKAGKGAERVDVGTYLGFGEQADGAPREETRIAMISGAGIIMDKSVEGSGFTGEPVVGADELAAAFDDAAKDKGIKGILFRVDSPGGSPSASETIRRALIRAQMKGKPVVVSMGEVAASGGYWVSMNGDRIIAEPGALTGSIGVISGKFVVEEAMKKWGISADGVRTSENAGMWNPTAPFSPVQRARVNALLDNTYQAFVSNVSAARKIPMEKMPDIAKGRVWTGEQALQNGLIDAVGGYDVALAEMRKLLKLDEHAPLALEDFPQQLSPLERLLELMARLKTQGMALSSLGAFMRDMQALARPVAGMAAMAREPVSLRMQLNGDVAD